MLDVTVQAADPEVKAGTWSDVAGEREPGAGCLNGLIAMEAVVTLLEMSS